MNIENVWQQAGGSDETLNKMLQNSAFGNLHSKLPLNKLKKTLYIGMIWAVMITTAYVTLFFIVNIWQVYIALATLIFFNIWISVDGWKLYKNINVNISSTNSLKEELQKNDSDFQRWWRIQERLGLFVYPIGGAGGFILGAVWGSGKTVEAFLYNPKMLSILGVIILILVPLGYYVAKWMFNAAYGKHLKKLKLLIDELSN